MSEKEQEIKLSQLMKQNLSFMDYSNNIYVDQYLTDQIVNSIELGEQLSNELNNIIYLKWRLGYYNASHYAFGGLYLDRQHSHDKTFGFDRSTRGKNNLYIDNKKSSWQNFKYSGHKYALIFDNRVAALQTKFKESPIESILVHTLTKPQRKEIIGSIERFEKNQSQYKKGGKLESR